MQISMIHADKERREMLHGVFQHKITEREDRCGPTPTLTLLPILRS